MEDYTIEFKRKTKGSLGFAFTLNELKSPKWNVQVLFIVYCYWKYVD